MRARITTQQEEDGGLAVVAALDRRKQTDELQRGGHKAR